MQAGNIPSYYDKRSFLAQSWSENSDMKRLLAGDPERGTTAAFQQCTSQPHGLGVLQGHANIYKLLHP